MPLWSAFCSTAGLPKAIGQRGRCEFSIVSSFLGGERSIDRSSVRAADVRVRGHTRRTRTHSTYRRQQQPACQRLGFNCTDAQDRKSYIPQPISAMRDRLHCPILRFPMEQRKCTLRCTSSPPFSSFLPRKRKLSPRELTTLRDRNFRPPNTHSRTCGCNHIAVALLVTEA